ncbi:hypothetical protein D3C81_1570260 [compost metagenome]
MLAAGDIEGVQLVEAAQVILEQRVGPAVGARAFGEHLGPAVAEEQDDPAVEGHVLLQQAHQGEPESGAVELFDQPADGLVPGNVLQGQTHVSTPDGLPRLRNYPRPRRAPYSGHARASAEHCDACPPADKNQEPP